jgi:hypothetical protein
LSNYSWTTVAVYKDSVNSTNLVFSGAITNGNGAVTLSGATINNTIDAGSTNTYVVVVSDALYNAGWTPDWSVSLTDLAIGRNATYNISQYQNLGELPLTETR